MSSSIRGTSRATLLTSPGDRGQRGNRPTRGVVNGGHAAFMVKFTHVLGPPRGVSPSSMVGSRPVDETEPARAEFL